MLNHPVSWSGVCGATSLVALMMASANSGYVVLSVIRFLSFSLKCLFSSPEIRSQLIVLGGVGRRGR